MHKYDSDLMTLTVSEIPWRYLTTAYGTGEMIPKMIQEKDIKNIQKLIEHQGTLWQVTPWTILFLAKIKLAELTTEEQQQINQLFTTILACCDAHQATNIYKGEIHDNPLTLLNPEYLWLENMNIDLEWEKVEPRGYDEKSFASYYWYSREFILAYNQKS
jgi:hypothetical protein